MSFDNLSTNMASNIFFCLCKLQMWRNLLDCKTNKKSFILHQFEKSSLQIRIKQINIRADSRNLDNDDLKSGNSRSLPYFAANCQTEMEIRQIYSLGIEKRLEWFLGTDYLNTFEQDCATLVLCNLYTVTRQTPPSPQLTSKVINLVEKGSFLTVSNCLGLIFNFTAIDEKQQIISKQFCLSICNQLEKQECDRVQRINVLRTMSILTKKSAPNQNFLFFLPSIIRLIYIINPQEEKQVSGYAFLSLYQVYVMHPKTTVQKINQQNLLPRFLQFVQNLDSIHVTAIMLEMLKEIIYQLNIIQITERLFPFLDKLSTCFCGGSLQIKQRICLIAISLLESKLIQKKVMAKQDFCCHLLINLKRQTNLKIVRLYVYIFAMIIKDQNQSPKAPKYRQQLEKIKKKFDHDYLFSQYMKEVLEQYLLK